MQSSTDEGTFNLCFPSHWMQDRLENSQQFFFSCEAFFRWQLFIAVIKGLSLGSVGVVDFLSMVVKEIFIPFLQVSKAPISPEAMSLGAFK